ncbi:glucuronate isomerase [Parabacteroides sp. PF5-5]|uniref:glucuronate isomerase n=1 Tax=unclassified Parabacteroides TaxID=2649774 RepID=UPI0024734FDF|nr:MULTISPECIES: glucuronate isomerase [unclassified Parabacteroides]MDH6306305.1 glucuronate isomerase [Parabacteroides sp. PH5-39]MDH6316904.1 glucuronate isomerase [Parabacteroides sp. PF5-13]MDH6320973.1 glucuronate isomerase [Parabacteroides sp. PH5-13]MDH6324705.1 glucuronate isomerase [Parabacteroides sp. PH5-8]MDH6328089.1 glucuronate isomerase [Parabacteroides sp. PH5-41]
MKTFLDADFLLQTDTAKELYHEHAAKMPIIDYHCHLIPQQIADNYQFADLTEIWLGGDHYKWRQMRANGVPEEYITGNKPSYEKFTKWAETMPYTMRNPLYHWTHLELSRIFGVNKVLNPSTAREIYDECSAKLQTEAFRAQAIMEKMNVKVVCTTDDPIDSLEYHKAIQASGFSVKVFPTWRPDKAMAIENPVAYNEYLARLEEVSGVTILTFDDLLQALQNRHDFFASVGCTVSDHGLETFYAEPYTDAEIRAIFQKVRAGKSVDEKELLKFRSAILYEGALMDARSGWVQQFHIGAIRNNNTKMFNILGPDTGYDAIHDHNFVVAMDRLLDRLNSAGMLAKTILYNLNPRDNDLMVTNAYNFNDGTTPGKIQFGAAWWFLDTMKGMENQMNSLSALGLLSRFVGMLTDSRSFLSYPRHEYFRRILCNMLGNDVENGELPVSELPFIKQMVENISYYNAKNYFGW